MPTEQATEGSQLHTEVRSRSATPIAWEDDEDRLGDEIRHCSPRGRRILNVVAAGLLLVLTAPLMLLIALLIKLTSRGPVLYVQARIGIDRRRNGNQPIPDCRRKEDLGGAPFTIYKFRTMEAETNDRGDQVWARPHDSRITPLGRVLRRHRLDELPQLFNVLRGDMNLVGPRPEQPKIFAKLRESIAGYERRQAVLPGLTGWAQVNQGYDSSMDDVRAKLHLDLEYIRRQSLLEDLRIMLRTIPVMMFRKGAF